MQNSTGRRFLTHTTVSADRPTPPSHEGGQSAARQQVLRVQEDVLLERVPGGHAMRVVRRHGATFTNFVPASKIRQATFTNRPPQAHAVCYRQMPSECDYGALAKIMLPPNCLTIPR